MKILQVSLPSQNWCFEKCKEISFTDIRENKTLFKVFLYENDVRVENKSQSVVHVFISKLRDGFALCAGESVTLGTGDCFGYQKSGDTVVKWYLVWSCMTRLRRMSKSYENILREKNTYFY